jgi:hypothetical protein
MLQFVVFRKPIFINVQYSFISMGLLNHLFGNAKGTIKELAMDEGKRMELWKQHVANSELRDSISRHFNYKNVDAAVLNFDETLKVLEQIESSISPELITIDEEFKVDKETLEELKYLEILCHVDGIKETFGSLKKKEKILIELFQKIYKCLMAELHLIRLIKKKPDNVRELLLELFELLYHLEGRLYKVFRDKYYADENARIHSDITRITRAIFLQEKIKQEKETDDEKFARELRREMTQPESTHRYRKLGESILEKIAEIAGSPFSKEADEYMSGLKKMERLIEDDKLMHDLVRKLKPKYGVMKIKLVVDAFRSAYTYQHFEDLMSEV